MSVLTRSEINSREDSVKRNPFLELPQHEIDYLQTCSYLYGEVERLTEENAKLKAEVFSWATFAVLPVAGGNSVDLSVED